MNKSRMEPRNHDQIRGFFEKLGITPELLGGEFEFEELLANNHETGEEQVAQVLGYTVPHTCGHDLIRIGGSRDGAYLVPNDLEGISACFSPGVSNQKDFEDELADRYGIKSYMCDFTSDVEKLRTPLREGMQFFEKKWLSSEPSADALTLDDWVPRCTGPDDDLLLQMDIEKAEYQVLLGVSEAILQRFRIVVIEFHVLQELVNSAFLEGVCKPVLLKLCKYFDCVHVHPNNNSRMVWDVGPSLKVPSLLELTFLRRDRCHRTADAAMVPHPLDILNVSSRPRIILGPPWNCTPVLD